MSLHPEMYGHENLVSVEIPVVQEIYGRIVDMQLFGLAHWHVKFEPLPSAVVERHQHQFTLDVTDWPHPPEWFRSRIGKIVGVKIVVAEYRDAGPGPQDYSAGAPT